MKTEQRSLKAYLTVSVKGAAMGAADVVPGVSGGTIALITGIYHELLHSLKSLTPAVLPVLFKEGPAVFWRQINGGFLLALFAGIALSIKTFAAVIGYALEHHPLLVWGFFTGLILSSVVLLGKGQSGWRVKEWLLCALGVAVVVGVSVAKPAQLPDEPWILFFGGFIAICAMILPGISGSFLLLLMGLYPVVLAAVNDVNLIALGFFLTGCVLGLLVFSRFLSWLLDRFYRPTLAVLIGFLVGSLNVTWPWKYVVETFENRHGELVPLVQKNVSPFSYERLVGGESQFLLVLLCFFAGFSLVLLFDFASSFFNKKN